MDNNLNNSNYRYEKKFIIKNKFLDSPELIFEFIKHDSKIDFPERKVNSIYYDTDKYDIAQQKIDGQLNSFKILIRFSIPPSTPSSLSSKYFLACLPSMLFESISFSG